MQSLEGRRILIVEDEYLLAMDLSRYLSKMGATILGPAPTIAAAEVEIPHADAAILDTDLGGQLAFPIADKLSRRGVPFVFFTAHSNIILPARFRYASRLSKPRYRSPPFTGLANAAEGFRSIAELEDVRALLPKLRLSARLILGDEFAADRLVELTLERAIDELQEKGRHLSTEDWLGHLLMETHARCGTRLLH